MVDLSAEMAELWTSLDAAPGGRGRLVEFIAAREGEGVSTVAREFAFYAARTLHRGVWLVALDLRGQTQAACLARDPARFGDFGPPAAATPDGSMFFSVQPPLKRPDGRAWPDARYISAHSAGGGGFWVTRFRREAMRGRQGVHVLPVPEYWKALRRHADLVVADEHDARAPSELRDDLVAAGAHCAGLFVNRVRVEPPGFLRGAGP